MVRTNLMPMRLAIAVLAPSLVMMMAACGTAPKPVAVPVPIPVPTPRGDSVLVWLGAMDLRNVEQGWEYARTDSSVDGNRLRIGGQPYEHGVGTHADAIARIRLDDARTFVADVGVDDEVISTNGARRGSVRFSFLVDRKAVLTTPVMRGGEPARHVEIDLHGAHELWLLVDGAGDGINYDHADWANAHIVQSLDAAPPILYRPAARPAIVLTPPAPATPRINGPAITAASARHPFLFRIPATGDGPMRFSARQLPRGLTLDPRTGIIKGSVARSGRYTVRVRAQNARGADERDLTIAIGEGLALTPPMGWNSWNVWGCAVDAQKIRDAADQMISTGLVQHGWNYINIDDCWMRKPGPDARDPHTGAILSNENFPDMRGLADYVHARGLKLGIYIGPNERTCQQYEASIGHERGDLEQFSRWGIDYVKYDWCSARRDSVQIKYQKFGALIKTMPRDIVYSLCEYGMDSVWTWGAQAGGNLWRTTGDIVDTWGSMSGIGFNQERMAPHAGPGHWNDPDMLVVGMLGWGPTPRPTRLTPDEQYTHISLWSMLAAPLLIGADMTKLDAFTLNLLTNDEVIAINQDPLGNQATRVASSNDVDVYTRRLVDGSWAVGLFNRSYDDQAIDSAWRTVIGKDSAQRVRDVWKQVDLAGLNAGLHAQVPTHGVLLLRVWPGT